jgi:hypothetical protein
MFCFFFSLHQVTSQAVGKRAGCGECMQGARNGHCRKGKVVEFLKKKRKLLYVQELFTRFELDDRSRFSGVGSPPFFFFCLSFIIS